MGGHLADPRGRAVESGHFDKEIVPVHMPEHKETDRDGNEVHVPATVVSHDDGPRPGTTVEKLAALQARLQRGRHCHGGQRVPAQRRRRRAALMSDERASELGMKPRARIIASTVVGDPPRGDGPRSGAGDTGAARRHGNDDGDIDVVEINEAFAAQIVPCKEQLDIPDEKLNPFGGAIALGHPFGMTGARIMTTLINDLETLDGTYGIESMCVAGGMGMAMLVERLG